MIGEAKQATVATDGVKRHGLSLPHPPERSPSCQGLFVQDLGCISYDRALAIQNHAVEDVSGGGMERVFVLEHSPVITLGRKSGVEYLRTTPEMLIRRGIQVVQTSRGGSVTCHYPGQLVVYPLLRLDRRPGGLRRLIHTLEQAVIRTLNGFGLHATRNPGRPGVWVQDRKIASIGLGLKRWVSYHGLALNVSRDTALFDLISPCGLPDVQITSVQGELGWNELEMAEVKQVLTAILYQELAPKDAFRHT